MAKSLRINSAKVISLVGINLVHQKNSSFNRNVQSKIIPQVIDYEDITETKLVSKKHKIWCTIMIIIWIKFEHILLYGLVAERTQAVP